MSGIKNKKILLSNSDWDALCIVLNGFRGSNLSLAEVVHLQKVTDLVQRTLSKYLDERAKLVAKGNKILNESQPKLAQLRDLHKDNIEHQEIVDYVASVNNRLLSEANVPIENLNESETEIEIPENWFESLRKAYARNVTFGENSYSDNALGRAAFVRTADALGVDESELESMSKKPKEKAE